MFEGYYRSLTHLIVTLYPPLQAYGSMCMCMEDEQRWLSQAETFNRETDKNQILLWTYLIKVNRQDPYIIVIILWTSVEGCNLAVGLAKGSYTEKVNTRKGSKQLFQWG